MPKLPLAVDIADVAAKADAVHEPLDVEMMARRLKEEHPEADVSRREIAESLRAASYRGPY